MLIPQQQRREVADAAATAFASNCCKRDSSSRTSSSSCSMRLSSALSCLCLTNLHQQASYSTLKLLATLLLTSNFFPCPCRDTAFCCSSLVLSFRVCAAVVAPAAAAAAAAPAAASSAPSGLLHSPPSRFSFPTSCSRLQRKASNPNRDHRCTRLLQLETPAVRPSHSRRHGADYVSQTTQRPSQRKDSASGSEADVWHAGDEGSHHETTSDESRLGPSAERRVYVVTLDWPPPVRFYQGGIPGLHPTAAPEAADEEVAATEAAETDDAGLKAAAAAEAAPGAGGGGVASWEGTSEVSPAADKDKRLSASRATERHEGSSDSDGSGPLGEAARPELESIGMLQNPNSNSDGNPSARGGQKKGGGRSRGGREESLNVRSEGHLESDGVEHEQEEGVYAAHLDIVHRNVLEKAKVDSSRHKLYSYSQVHNGFAALLSPQEAETLRSLPIVHSVTASQPYRLLTTHTPQFLNLPRSAWRTLGNASSAGEGVVIGVIDTGVWPESASFSTKQPYRPPPKSWRGSCSTSADFAGCNGKIIGAKTFREALSSYAPIDFSMEYPSVRDVVGHGTHTASIAAGNSATPVSFRSTSFGAASGMAPRARLAIYKVIWTFWGEPQADGADILAAVDAAVADGVDVISMSLGSMGSTLFDPVRLAFLRATSMGIVPVLSAGNFGSPYSKSSNPFFQAAGDTSVSSTLENAGPWMVVVAASSHGRVYSTSVTLGNGKQLSGPSNLGLTAGSKPRRAPIVTGSNAAKSILLAGAASRCVAGSLSPARVRGKIVVCDLSGIPSSQSAAGEVASSQTVAAAGGVGAIVIVSRSWKGSPQFFFLPTCVVQFASGQILKQYIFSSKNPSATIPVLTAGNDPSSPEIPYFSSAGPLQPDLQALSPSRYQVNDILQPDVAAPGVDIWAAFSQSPRFTSSMVPLPGLSSQQLPFNLLTGTSFAAPHVAGIAALLKQRHPNWSAFAIKSAMQTTARALNKRNSPIVRRSIAGVAQPATAFDMGSGEVNPSIVLDPGLVFDSSKGEMVRFLVGIGSELAKSAGLLANAPSMWRVPLDSFNLNMANIAVSRVRGTMTVRRTVTCVSGHSSRYIPHVQAPDGVRVSVVPSMFDIAPNQKVTFVVTFIVDKPSWNFKFGSLTWMDGKHAVRSVLAVQPIRSWAQQFKGK